MVHEYTYLSYEYLLYNYIVCWGSQEGYLACTYRLLPLFLFLVFFTLVPRPSHCLFLTACSMQKQRGKAWCPFYHVSDVIVDRGEGRGEVSTNKTVTNGVGSVNHSSAVVYNFFFITRSHKFCGFSIFLHPIGVWQVTFPSSHVAWVRG